MSIVLDIIIIGLLALGGIIGWKAGVLKSLVKLVGLISITILALTFKGSLASFLMDFLPFANLGGAFDGLLSINIFIYNAISFIIIFILLYCLLNIVLSITGFLDTLLKFTVVWILPSKILGAIVGVFEYWLFILVLVFTLAQFPISSDFVYTSNIAPVMMKYTPIIGPLVRTTANSMDQINELLKNNDGLTERELDLQILTRALSSGIISKDQLNRLIEEEKLDFKNVAFG